MLRNSRATAPSRPSTATAIPMMRGVPRRTTPNHAATTATRTQASTPSPLGKRTIATVTASSTVATPASSATAAAIRWVPVTAAAVGAFMTAPSYAGFGRPVRAGHRPGEYRPAGPETLAMRRPPGNGTIRPASVSHLATATVGTPTQVRLDIPAPPTPRANTATTSSPGVRAPSPDSPGDGPHSVGTRSRREPQPHRSRIISQGCGHHPRTPKFLAIVACDVNDRHPIISITGKALRGIRRAYRVRCFGLLISPSWASSVVVALVDSGNRSIRSRIAVVCGGRCRSVVASLGGS